MTTRERIRAAIDAVPDDRLSELHHLIERFRESPAAPPKTGIMARLRSISIEGPPDFASNLDLYLSGEKRVDEDVP